MTGTEQEKQDMQDALDALRGARAIFEHNPTTQNERTVEACQQVLDGAIEKYGFHTRHNERQDH